ncbi:hypothetical protein L7F22_064029 [Adiantum nelumboides]|nr:hypothetical protein [Adiantum nelumboides]
MDDNNKENRMSIDDFDFAHEDATDDTPMLVNYLVTRFQQAMGNPALRCEVQQQRHAYGILPPPQQERDLEKSHGETSKRGLSTAREVENPYQELKQLFEGKPSSKKKGHAQHEGSPSKEREGSESQEESMEDVAPRRKRAQGSPTPTKRKRSPHSPHRRESKREEKSSRKKERKRSPSFPSSLPSSSFDKSSGYSSQEKQRRGHRRTVAYTNHTVLPEALERWPLDILKKLLPRHIEIIEKIDEQFILAIFESQQFADKKTFEETVNKMRILENLELSPHITSLFESSSEESDEVSISESDKDEDEDVTNAEGLEEEVKTIAKPPVAKPPGMVRMANLCVISAHTVNGVAAIHSDILKNEVFNDFYKIWPSKFQNKTNGVTPRRWLYFCNPELSKVITKWVGSEDWVLKTDDLAKLRQFADNEELHKEWRQAKRKSKLKLAAYVKEKTGYTINPDALFDVQIKRIHEYKRQFLNILGLVYRYKKMKEMTPEERKSKYTPRVCIFGGKAFATYVQAKRIVKLITDVGATINNDPDIGDLLKAEVVRARRGPRVVGYRTRRAQQREIH